MGSFKRVYHKSRNNIVIIQGKYILYVANFAFFELELSSNGNIHSVVLI